jgi:hypothetical protein
MMQIVEQTKEEKIAMYMKCNKRALAEMLYQCNLIIEAWTPKKEPETVTTTTFSGYDD